jgi:Domain of unknown function (DUF4337)
MAFEALGRGAELDNQRDRDRWIGVYIGILAVILAICSMGGDNAAKEATRNNIAATDTWAFMQAKNIRRQMMRLQVDDLEILAASQPQLSDTVRAMIDAKVSGYKDYEKRLTSEPSTGEGIDELMPKAKAYEAARDLALRQDPYFDYGQALLQIAIVLASIAIISGGTMLLGVSGLLGALGTLLTLNGFMLIASLPYLG